MQSIRSPNNNFRSNQTGPNSHPPAPLYIPFRSFHPGPKFPCRFPSNDHLHPSFYEGRGGCSPSYQQQSPPPPPRPHPHYYHPFEKQRYYRSPPHPYNDFGRHNNGGPPQFHGGLQMYQEPVREMVQYYPSSPPLRPPRLNFQEQLIPAPPLEFVLRTSIKTSPPRECFPNSDQSNHIPRVDFGEIHNFNGPYRPQYPIVPNHHHNGHLGNKRHGKSVAVGPVSPKTVVQNGSNLHQNSSTDDDEERSTDSSDCPGIEEEYEPEHPEIGVEPNCHQSISRKVETMAEGNPPVPEIIPGIIACDEDGFYEVYVVSCVSRYPTGTGRMIEIAGYGVWSSNDLHLSGVLDASRPQTIKPIMIFGSAKAVEFMKTQGYSRIRLNLESDYLNNNVLGWISKYMENPDAQPGNWDEFKYQAEIKALCASATGMIIKWSHVLNTSNKRMGLLKAKYLAKAATDTWIKELKDREEAVGTGSYD